MTINHGLSAIAIALTFLAFLPYIRSIHTGRTRPHIFSWIVWASVTFTVFLAQMAGGGGAGAWPIGLSGLLTLYVAWLAWRKRGEIVVTRSDWFFLSLSLSSLPLWVITKDPLWAVVVLTFADSLGFVPTFRKAFVEPRHERISFYALTALRNAVAILALEKFSLTTVLFPGVVGVLAALFVLMGLLRRMTGRA